jgi:hypothetical protein
MTALRSSRNRTRVCLDRRMHDLGSIEGIGDRVLKAMIVLAMLASLLI